MEARQQTRCGLVGPGRRRQGLGPFLARELEAAGCAVAAVAGRDPGRTQEAAAGLADRFGHPVAAHTDVAEMLAQEQLDALVVAAPIPAHLPALRAGLAASVAVLCEKPLVAPEEAGEVPELLGGFADRGLLLMENCQWPYTLPALRELHPDLADGPIREVEMRLSPTGQGRSMLVDAVSHFLSLLQGLVHVDASTRLRSCELSDHRPETEELRLDLELESPFPRFRSTLYLARCEAQPRPAWIAVNGRRGERRIRSSDYTMSFWDGSRSVRIEDPLTGLVRDFVDSTTVRDLDRVRAEGRAVRERFRLFCAILDAWGR